MQDDNPQPRRSSDIRPEGPRQVDVARQMNWDEIAQNIDDPQKLVDDFFRTALVLSSKTRSRRRMRLNPETPPEIEVSEKMNWEDVGQELRTRYIARATQRCDCDWCSRYQFTKRGRRENYWVFAVAFAILGDPSVLVKHLDSRRTLSRFDRMVLADLLEVAFKGEIGSELHPAGRPKKFAVHSCASVAQKYYQEWKAINQRSGIPDWGHSDEMKDEACRVALEMHRLSRKGGLISDHPMNVVPSFDEVRELIDRSAARRTSAKRRSD